MPRIIEGRFEGAGHRFAILLSRWNALVGERLLDGCLDALRRHGVGEEAITIIRVPGSLELPVVARRVADTLEVDAIIALGCVIRGDTPHFDVVVDGSARGLSQCALETGVPVMNGVLTCDSLEQALQRAGAKAGNKGGDVAMAALEMASLLASLPKQTS